MKNILRKKVLKRIIAIAICVSLVLQNAPMFDFIKAFSAGEGDPIELTISGSLIVKDKEYNGDVDGEIDSTSEYGLEGEIAEGDNVSLDLIGAEVTFAYSGVAENVQVTISGLALTGEDASKYSLDNDTYTTTANIIQREIGIVGLSVSDKVYNGDTDVVIVGMPSINEEEIIQGEDVQLNCENMTASFADSAAGEDKIVTISGLSLSGANAQNYKLENNIATTATINPKPLKVEGLSITEKTYDGTVNADITGIPVLVEDGIVPGDDVELSVENLSAEFENADAGEDKVAIIKGLGLEGEQADNYAIDTSEIKGTITQCEIDITAEELTIKKYLLDISKLKYSVSGKPENGVNIDETGLVIKYKEDSNGEYTELTQEILMSLPVGDYYYKYFDMDASNPNYSIEYKRGKLHITEPTLAKDESDGHFYTISKVEQEREWSQSISITPQNDFELEFSDNVVFEENEGIYSLKTEGRNEVEIKIIDSETNKVIHTKKEILKLDSKTPEVPNVSAIVNNDTAYNGEATAEDIVFTVSQPDNMPVSGIEKYQYKKGDGEWTDIAKVQISESQEVYRFTLETNHSGIISFRAISNSGVVGNVKDINVLRDNNKPNNVNVSIKYTDDKGVEQNYEYPKRITDELKVTVSGGENGVSGISKYQYKIGLNGTWRDIVLKTDGTGELILNDSFNNISDNIFFRAVSGAGINGEEGTSRRIVFQPHNLGAPVIYSFYYDDFEDNPQEYRGELTNDSLIIRVAMPYYNDTAVQYSRTNGEDAIWTNISKQDDVYELVVNEAFVEDKTLGTFDGKLYFRYLDGDNKPGNVKEVTINYDITAPEVTDGVLDITDATVVQADEKDKMYYGEVSGVKVNVTATDLNNIAEIYYYTSDESDINKIKTVADAVWRLAYDKESPDSSSMLDAQNNVYSIVLKKADNSPCNGYVYVKVVDDAGNAAFSQIANTAKTEVIEETTSFVPAEYTNPYILYNDAAPNKIEVSATVVGTGEKYTSDQLIGKDVVIKVVSKDNALTLIDQVFYKEDNKDYVEITQWKERSYENGYYEVEFTISPENNDASNYYFKMVGINGKEIVSKVFIVNIYKNIVDAGIKVSGTKGNTVETGADEAYVDYYSNWFKKGNVTIKLSHNLKDDDKRLGKINTLYYVLQKADSNGKFSAVSSTGTQYNSEISITESGYYRVVVWNDDGLGNKSNIKYAYFHYDAQTIKREDVKVTFANAEKEYDKYNKYSVYAKENLKIKLSGKDDFSGIAGYEYRLNKSDNWKSVDWSKENGYHIVLNNFSGTVNIRALDKAGNVSDVFSTEPIMVGDGVPTAPKISVTTESGKTLKSGAWTEEKIVIILKGSDLNYDIGINKYQYSVDGGNTWKTMKDTTNTVKRDEKVDGSDSYVKDKLSISADTYNTYSFRAVSNTGAVSKVVTYKVRIDNIQPENSKVKYSKATGKTNPDNGKWYTEAAVINITAAKGAENEAPVTTYYKLWKEGETATTNQTDSNVELKVTNDGVYNFEMWTKDAAGNKSATTVTKKIYVDKKAPSNILIGYTDEPDMKELETGKVEDYYSQPVKVTISATDFNSGVYGFRYTIRGEVGDNNEKTGILKATKVNDIYVADMMINPEYLGGLTISAIDNAGNESEKFDDSVFVVSNDLPTAPTLIVTSEDNILTNGQWTTKEIEISISDSKVIAGISGYEYMIEGEDVWRKCDTIVSKTNATNDKPSNINEVKLVLTEDQEETYLFRAISNSGIHGEISRFDIKKDSVNPEVNASHQDATLIGGKFYNETQKVEIVINELNFDPSKVELTVRRDGNAVNVGNITWTSTGNVHSGVVTLSESGDYTFEIVCVDKADNTDEVKLDDFTIDLIAPELSISYDKDAKDKYCNSKRVATIKVIERNFDADNVKLSLTTSSEDIIISQGEWIHNGDVHTKSIEFTKDGEYSVAVECTDMAMNEGVNIPRQEFVIDTVKPEVSISGVENTSANAKDITIVVDAKDSYLANISYKLTSNNKEVKLDVVKSEDIEGGKRETLSSITVDGIYHFTYTVTDKAGNTTTDEYIFSVNKDGAAFEAIEDNSVDSNTGYAKEDYKPVIKIMDVDTITILSVAINGNEQTAGEDYEYDSATGTLRFLKAMNEDGKYSVTVDVKDAAGNVSFMEPYEFMVDHTAPNLIVSGAEDGKTYNEAVTVVLKPDNAEDKIVKVIVNGIELSEDKYVRSTTDNSVQITLTEYQSYTISAIAEDPAGNTVTMEEVNFKLMDSVVAGIPDYVLAIIIGAIIAAIAVVVVIIVKKKKNN